MDILYRKVVQEALHDSTERFPEPACHPGTRNAILEKLGTWAVDPSPVTTLLWLHGAAGIGKSAIAQMFAGDCQTGGRHGASFFFKSGDLKRGTWHGLFATLAYQLAHSIPDLLLPVRLAVENDKLLLGRNMSVQFRKLLIEPFSRISPLHARPVVVVDGLDECEDRQIHQQILRLFLGAIQANQLPIHLLICSRSEPHIREILSAEGTSAMCEQVQLSGDPAAFDDIRTYLRDEFARIKLEINTRGVDLGAVWPTPETLDHLVIKSSGIFIYATTVIRFLGDDYSHPVDRLEAVLALDPASTAPLDDLYTEILSVVTPKEQHLLILHTILNNEYSPMCGGGVDPEDVDLILALRPGTSRLMLRGLHSLFKVPRIRTQHSLGSGIWPLHQSLVDYLGDFRRSGQWCIAVPPLRSEYLHCMIRSLSSPPPALGWWGIHA